MKEYHIWINGLFALVGVAWAAINVNSYPMVVEMSKGSDIGKFTGFYYTFSMAAQIVTPILSGFLLEHVGYFILFPYAAFFVVIAFFTMLFVRHGDSRPLRRKAGWRPSTWTTDSNGDYHERKERQKKYPKAGRSNDLRRTACGDVCCYSDRSASGFPGWDRLFQACLVATIGLPILLWIYIWLYQQIRERKEEKEENQ